MVELPGQLEDKLGGLFGYVTFLIPIATAILSFGVRDEHLLVVSLGALGLVYLVPVVAFVLIGSRARPVWLVTPDLIDEISGLADREQALRISEEKRLAIEKNLPITWELNNALSAARGCLAWAILVLSVGTGFQLAGGS